MRKNFGISSCNIANMTIMLIFWNIQLEYIIENEVSIKCSLQSI
jgi:hypothetical protein